jgi:hypothetical protein
MPVTRTEVFNKTLECQQNLVAGYDTNAQLVAIESLMDQQAPWSTVLRTVILISQTSNGIKAKDLEVFKREFLQVYGYHHLPRLIALEKLHLLVKSPPAVPQPFASLRKALRLIVDDVDDGAPNDISYVYSGYAPISIRLVQCVTQKNAVLAGTPGGGVEGDVRSSRHELPKAHPISGWKGFEDVLASIPGATVDVRQKTEGKSEAVRDTCRS